MLKQKKNGSSITILLIIGALLLVTYMFSNTEAVEGYKTSEVVDLFKAGSVEEYELDFGNGNLTVYLKEGVPNKVNPEPIVNKDGEEENILTYKVTNVVLFLDRISEYDDDVVYDWSVTTDPMTTFNTIMTLFMIVALVGVVVFFYTQTKGGSKGGVSIGRIKTKELDPNNRKTFKDVAGVDEEKGELEEIVDFLKNPKKYDSLGARIPKGVLLAGPPGTGKTLLAKATAGEAGVPFFSISGSEFMEMYVGVGASRVRDLFDKAKKNAPSIIFIDEIDAVGRQRGSGIGGGHDEREQTLNQLLVEMDGFGLNAGVIVMASTNRADILDKALLRPGRFDRQVYVGAPDVKGREEILKVHTAGKPMAPDVELSYVAKSTPGFTGADLENLINEAALMAAKKNKKAITQAEIEEATIKVIAGPEKRSKVVTEKEKILVSYHEAGHAVATYYSETADPVTEISIIPRGMAGGYTLSMPETDSSYTTKTQMKDNIVTLLGGRIAEQIILGDISTGASNDLERVTATAKAMVKRYGFSEKLGTVVYGNNQGYAYGAGDTKDYSEAIATEIDEEIRDIINEGYSTCTNILKDNIDKLHEVANELMVTEKINAKRFIELMEGAKAITAEEYLSSSKEEEEEESIVDVVVNEETETLEEITAQIETEKEEVLEQVSETLEESKLEVVDALEEVDEEMKKLLNEKPDDLKEDK